MKTTLEEPRAGSGMVPFVLSLSLDGIKHFPILDSSRGVGMRSALVTLQPGENVGSHNTGGCEELLVFLDGIGEVQAQGFGKQRVSRESVVYIPAANQHDVSNVGSTPLRYVYIVSQIHSQNKEIPS
jgi:mannose-6-phosphate isomerase-like protein (cupin superfamily)